MAAVIETCLQDKSELLDAALRRAKYSVPALPRRFVRRARVHDTLAQMTESDGSGASLTIVSAPVGSGKTTLVAAAARERVDGNVAWCSLDATDNDPRVFASSILEAILASAWSDRVRPAPRSATVRADALDEATRIAAYGPPLTLVLDGCEHIALASIHGTIGRLARQAPPPLTVILSTTHDMHLSMRGLGHVRTLRTSELAFNVDEVCEMFAKEGVRIGSDTAGTITRWTEGCASAVALAASAYRDTRDRDRIIGVALRGEGAAHMSLFERVLERLPEEHRAVLLASSVVDVISGELAATLSRVEDAPALLADLARRDVFFDAVPNSPGWYQHRHPSRELLAAVLRYDTYGEPQELHREAAEWFAASGDASRALHAAVRGRDAGLIVALVRRLWIAATVDELDVVLDDIPPFEAPCTPDAALVEAAVALEAGDREGASERLDACEHALAGTCEESRLFGALLRLRLARDASSATGIRHACTLVESLLDEETASRRRPDVALLVMRARAEAFIIDGDLDAARQLLEDACTGGIADGREIQVASATAALAVVTAVSGRVRRATALVDELGGETWFSGFDFCRGVGATAHAICAYHLDNLPVAQVLASDAQASLRSSVYRDAVLALLRARIAANIGDECAARRLANRAASVATDALRSAVADAVGLAREGADGGDSGTTHPYRRAITDVWNAKDQFDAFEWTSAWASLDHALTIAERNGYRRLFPDSGRELHRLVAAYICEARPLAQVAWQLLQRLPADSAHTNVLVVETLTERELAVLRHLPTMKSNREIAGEMYFSVNTVKTHLKSIYRKLGVNCRRAAVEEARGRSIL